MTFLEWLGYMLGLVVGMLGVWFVDMSSHRIRGKRFHYGDVVVMTEAEPGLGGPAPPPTIVFGSPHINDAKHAAFLTDLVPDRGHITDLETEWLKQEIVAEGGTAPVGATHVSALWQLLFDATSIPGQSLMDRRYAYLGVKLADVQGFDTYGHINNRLHAFWNRRAHGTEIIFP